MTTNTQRLRTAAVLAGISALALTACTGPAGPENPTGSAAAGGGGSITLGTLDKVSSLDPAGSYDNGSFMVMNQIYPFLLNSEPGSADPVPDIAESAEFTAPTDFTVKLKSGLTFANGHTLDSKDVKHSFDRMVAINDPNGPASLLGNLAGVETPDATTVVFKLEAPDDQTFAQILSTPAAPIVDDEVFPADALLSDDEIASSGAFAGPYTIDSFSKNELISFKANPDYEGVLGAPKSETANIKYYADANNLKLDVQQGNIDVASRSLTPTDIADLEDDPNVTVHKGPGGELRYIVFNFDTMPYGAKTPQADPAKALAVRQAVAHLVDREAIADQVYKGTYLPVYSFVPQGFAGATEPLKEMYGDGSGKPSVEKATAVLQEAGVTVPVALNLQYNPDHYGSSSGDEYAMVKSQLDSSGLFNVNLQSTEWVTYTKDRVADVYPAYQLGWFPDYSDADNYLSPFFATDNFINNHYVNAEVDKMIAEQRVTTDSGAREELIGDIQEAVAEDLSTVPLLQGAQVAVAGKDVQGVEDTLDASFKFRLGVLSK